MSAPTPAPDRSSVAKLSDGTHDITSDLKFPASRTLTVNGTLSGTPTGGELNLGNLTLTLPETASTPEFNGYFAEPSTNPDFNPSNWRSDLDVPSTTEAAKADLSNATAQAILRNIQNLDASFAAMALRRSDVLAYWRLNEASGAVVDSGPSGLNGTLVGSVTRSAAPLSIYPSDFATTFSGAGAFNLGNVLNLERTDSWSVEFLINASSVANAQNYAVISKLRSSAPFTGWEINLEGKSASTYRIGAYAGNAFPTPAILVKSSELLSVGTIYHVVVSFTPSGQGLTLAAATLGLPNIRIWINGREQKISGDSDNTPYGTVGSTIVHSGNCYIGSQSNDSRRLIGSLDELAVYRGVIEYSYIKARAQLALEANPVRIPDALRNPPKNIIIDFDMNTDCDDCGDLHQALALRARGEMELLAIIVSTKSDSAAPAARAIRDYWDATTVPIGAYQGSLGVGSDGSVSGAIRTQFRAGDSRVNYTDDLIAYRTALASAPDNSVSIVSTGFAISLKRLMDSPGDGISALTGAELIARKVALLVMVGNVYPYNANSDVEFNAASDPASWKQIIETWPTPIVFSGGELGEFVRTAPPTNLSDVNTNPTRFGYNYFVSNNPRQSWGQLGFWFVVSPESFALSRAFTQTVNASTGQASVLSYTDSGTRYFLRLADKSPVAVQAELNGLLQPYALAYARSL